MHLSAGQLPFPRLFTNYLGYHPPNLLTSQPTNQPTNQQISFVGPCPLSTSENTCFATPLCTNTHSSVTYLSGGHLAFSKSFFSTSGVQKNTCLSRHSTARSVLVLPVSSTASSCCVRACVHVCVCVKGGQRCMLHMDKMKCRVAGNNSGLMRQNPMQRFHLGFALCKPDL